MSSSLLNLIASAHLILVNICGAAACNTVVKTSLPWRSAFPRYRQCHSLWQLQLVVTERTDLFCLLIKRYYFNLFSFGV